MHFNICLYNDGRSGHQLECAGVLDVQGGWCRARPPPSGFNDYTQREFVQRMSVIYTIALEFGLRLDHVGSHPTFAPVNLEEGGINNITLVNRQWTLQ